jgi:hypothetical protein
MIEREEGHYRSSIELAATAPASSCNELAVTDWMFNLSQLVKAGKIEPHTALLACQFATERRMREHADARVDRLLERVYPRSVSDKENGGA